MVLNETVRGAAGIAVADQSQGLETKVRESPATQEDIKAAAVSIIEEYTSLNNWHLITVSEETDRDRQDQQVRIFQSFKPQFIWCSGNAFKFLPISSKIKFLP